MFVSDIGNIHAMRASIDTIHGLIHASDHSDQFDQVDWGKNLHSSCWLQHIHRLLVGAKRVAMTLAQYGSTEGSHSLCRQNVLVHCSDGWDRTSQICALAQLLLDDHFRTRRGFAVLVNKVSLVLHRTVFQLPPVE